jgi:hypothetical protein
MSRVLVVMISHYARVKSESQVAVFTHLEVKFHLHVKSQSVPTVAEILPSHLPLAFSCFHAGMKQNLHDVFG